MPANRALAMTRSAGFGARDVPRLTRAAWEPTAARRVSRTAACVVLWDVASRSVRQVGDRRVEVISNAAQHELDLLGCTGDFQDNRDAVPFMFDFRRRPWLPVE